MGNGTASIQQEGNKAERSDKRGKTSAVRTLVEFRSGPERPLDGQIGEETVA